MIILFILGILLGGVSVIFALQNVTVITVKFFQWELTSSLAVVIISAILAGMLITLFILIPGSVNRYYKNKNLKKEILKLEEELRKQKELTVFAKNVPPTVETIKIIESGVIEEH